MKSKNIGMRGKTKMTARIGEMRSTYDAIEGLEWAVENLKGLVPSPTGTPVSPKALGPTSHGASAGEHPNLPARKQTERMNTPSGSYKRLSLSEEKQRKEDKHMLIALAAVAVALVVFCFLGPLL